jgi:hypothetical protein
MERNRGAIWESGIQCLELSHTLLVSGGIATTHEDFVDGIFSQRPYTSILRNLYDTSISSQMLVQRFVAEIKCGDRTYTIDSVHYSRGANKLPTFRLWRKARSPKTFECRKRPICSAAGSPITAKSTDLPVRAGSIVGYPRWYIPIFLATGCRGETNSIQ